jgi:hypothetical protein
MTQAEKPLFVWVIYWVRGSLVLEEISYITSRYVGKYDSIYNMASTEALGRSHGILTCLYFGTEALNYIEIERTKSGNHHLWIKKLLKMGEVLI